MTPSSHWQRCRDAYLTAGILALFAIGLCIHYQGVWEYSFVYKYLPKALQGWAGIFVAWGAWLGALAALIEGIFVRERWWLWQLTLYGGISMIATIYETYDAPSYWMEGLMTLGVYHFPGWIFFAGLVALIRMPNR